MKTHSHTKTQPFSTTRTVFLFALIGALAALGIYGYVFYHVRTTEQSIASLQAQASTLETQENEVTEIKKNLTDTQAQEDQLASYFVDPNDIVPFLETIESYGTEAGVSTKFTAVTIAKSPTALNLSITADGSFADLYRFIALLEAAPYELSITNAQIAIAVPNGLTPTGDGPHSSGWEASIAVSVTSVAAASTAPAQPTQ